MKQATLVALRAILESDVPRSKDDRDLILQTLGLTTGPNFEPSQRIVAFADAAERLHRTTKTVHNLIARGVLRSVKYPGFKRASGVLASDLDSLLMSSAGHNGGVA